MKRLYVDPLIKSKIQGLLIREYSLQEGILPGIGSLPNLWSASAFSMSRSK